MLKIMEMHSDLKLSSILSGIGILQRKVDHILAGTGATLDEEDAGERVVKRVRHSVATTELKDAGQEALEVEETRVEGLLQITSLIEQEMQAAVAQMNFEQAARFRDAIAVLKPTPHSIRRCPDNGNPSEGLGEAGGDAVSFPVQENRHAAVLQRAVSIPVEENRQAAVLERALARASARSPAVHAEVGVFVPGSCLHENEDKTLSVEHDKLTKYLRVCSNGSP